MICKERLIPLTQKVIRFNSENPPGNEYALSRFITQDMKSLGLDVRTYSFKKNRPNIVAVLKGTLPRKKASVGAILITPHFDTVPIGQGWNHPPLGGEIDRGKIFGRGASDDKGNLACCLEVMRSLVEDGVQLKRDLIMAATVDEETGSHLGIIPLLAKGILIPEVALILDSDEFDAIIAQKGLIHARIQIFGKKAHGAYNWRGVNAIELASQTILFLKQHQFRFKRHPLLHPPTMNVGVIKGGDKVNIVADFCEFALDTRFLPQMNGHRVLQQIKAIIKKVTPHFKILIDDMQSPYEIDAQHPFVKTYLKTAQKMGIKTMIKGSEGATVITFFKKYGIPAFATGFGSRGTAHTTDEYVRINNLTRGAQLLQRFLMDYDAQYPII